MKTVTRDEVQRVIDTHANVIIVDALDEDAFAEGHLPGAINIPADKVEELAPALLKNKDQKIITYCGKASCQKSKLAAGALEGMGFVNVSAYEAGKEDWTGAGLPLANDDTRAE